MIDFCCKKPSVRSVVVFRYFLLLTVLLWGYSLEAQPVIDDFTPAKGPVGTSVSITGSNFSSIPSQNIVYFGGVKATVLSATANLLIVSVPVSAMYAPVSVTVNNLTAYSEKIFNVTFTGSDSLTFNTLTDPVNVSTGFIIYYHQLIDLDGDGKLDIVSSGFDTLSNEGIYLFRNTGSQGVPSFASKIFLSPATDREYLTIADFDGDGKPDIVSRDGPGWNSLSVYRNTSIPGNITFTPGTKYSTVSRLNRLAAADFNSDGRPDIVFSNFYDSTITIIKNLTTGPGSILFGEEVVYPAGNTPHGLATGDLDGDQKPDIGVLNYYSNTVSIFRNTSSFGTISFSQKTDFPTGEWPGYLIISDLDGDEKADLTISTGGHGKTIMVLRNSGTNGSLAFEARKDFGIEMPQGAENVAIGDLNGDGKPDIGVTYWRFERFVLLGNTSSIGTISFDPAVEFPFIAHNYPGITIGDIDGDARPEVLTTNHRLNRIYIYANRSGDSTTSITSFSPAIAPSGTLITVKGRLLRNVTAVRFGGVDANSFSVESDSTISAVVGAGTSGSVSVISPDGRYDLAGFIYTGPEINSFSPSTGGYGSVITIKGKNLSSVTEVKFGEITAGSFIVIGDSIIQAVVGIAASGNVTLVSPNGSGFLTGFTFTDIPKILDFSPYTGPIGSVVTIHGLNFDSLPNNNIVYFGAVKATVTNATFNQLSVVVPPGASQHPITVTTKKQLTAYSKKPFQVTFTGGKIAFNKNSFYSKVSFPTVSNPAENRITDLDGDGKPDVILINAGTNVISVFRNVSVQGSLNFEQRIDLTSTSPKKMATGDIDGDGKHDLIVINSSLQGFELYKNTSTIGQISFALPVVIPNANKHIDISIADFDGDGKPDVALLEAKPSFTGYVTIYRNTGSPGTISFEKGWNSPTEQNPTALLLNDLDGDGMVDIAVTNIINNAVRTYRNISSSGTILFDYTATPATGMEPNSVAAADLNADGFPDLVVTNKMSAFVTVLKNNGFIFKRLKFDERSDLSFPGTPDADMGFIDDLNGDGQPDIVISRSAQGVLSVFKNIGDSAQISFSTPVEYPIGLGASNINVTDLDGDGQPELLASVSGENHISVLSNTSTQAMIIPAGTNPVTGIVNQKITVDSTVQLLNGTPYVQRHYDIEPLNNPAVATATLTLYFTQQEFDNFNATAGIIRRLPGQPGDTEGISNIRIFQYHGSSTTGLPSDYPGLVTVINPEDNNIIWNPTALSWEITFDVNGFSGFFLSTRGFAYYEVAAPSISVTGPTIACKGTNVILTSSAVSNNQWFRDSVRIDGAISNTYTVIESGSYTVTTTIDDITSKHSTGKSITVNPLPEKPLITFNGSELVSSSDQGNQWYRDGNVINGATNQLYKPSGNGHYSVIVTKSGCSSIASDNYHYSVTAVINIDNSQFIKLSPNPYRNRLFLNFNISGIYQLNVQVFDLQGRQLNYFNRLSNGSELNLQKLKSGIYVVKIFNETSSFNYTLKIVKSE